MSDRRKRRGPCFSSPVDPAPPKQPFFSCHDSGNRTLSFSHACCMLMPNQLTNVSWLGRKKSPNRSLRVLQRKTPPRLSFSLLPTVPSSCFRGSFCKAEVLICLLLYHSQSASELPSCSVHSLTNRLVTAFFEKKPQRTKTIQIVTISNIYKSNTHIQHITVLPPFFLNTNLTFKASGPFTH